MVLDPVTKTWVGNEGSDDNLEFLAALEEYDEHAHHKNGEKHGVKQRGSPLASGQPESCDLSGVRGFGDLVGVSPVVASEGSAPRGFPTKLSGLESDDADSDDGLERLRTVTAKGLGHRLASAQAQAGIVPSDHDDVNSMDAADRLFHARPDSDAEPPWLQKIEAVSGRKRRSKRRHSAPPRHNSQHECNAFKLSVSEKRALAESASAHDALVQAWVAGASISRRARSVERKRPRSSSRGRVVRRNSGHKVWSAEASVPLRASTQSSVSVARSRSASREALQTRAKKVLELAKQTLERTSKATKPGSKPAVPTPIPTIQPTWLLHAASPVVVAASASTSPKASTPPQAAQHGRSKSRRRSGNHHRKAHGVPQARSMSKNRRHIITALEVCGFCVLLGS